MGASGESGYCVKVKIVLCVFLICTDNFSILYK